MSLRARVFLFLFFFKKNTNTIIQTLEYIEKVESCLFCSTWIVGITQVTLRVFTVKQQELLHFIKLGSKIKLACSSAYHLLVISLYPCSLWIM